VGDVSEVVKVEGEPVIDLQNNETSTTFDQTLLQDIPSGRDPWSPPDMFDPALGNIELREPPFAPGQFRSKPLKLYTCSAGVLPCTCIVDCW